MDATMGGKAREWTWRELRAVPARDRGRLLERLLKRLDGEIREILTKIGQTACFYTRRLTVGAGVPLGRGSG